MPKLTDLIRESLCDRLDALVDSSAEPCMSGPLAERVVDAMNLLYLAVAPLSISAHAVMPRPSLDEFIIALCGWEVTVDDQTVEAALEEVLQEAGYDTSRLPVDKVMFRQGGRLIGWVTFSNNTDRPGRRILVTVNYLCSPVAS